MNLSLHRFLPVFFTLAALTGCGGQSAFPSSSPAPTPPTPTSPAPIPVSITGNWEFSVQLPAVDPTQPFVLPNIPVETVFGSFSTTGTSVTSILHSRPLAFPNCVAIATDLPTSGTIDDAGNLTLTTPLAGGTATITANVVNPATRTLPDGTIQKLPFFSGNYQVVAGTCAQASIPLTVFPVANVTGTYTGTLTQIILPTSPIPASTISVTATFNQSSTPNADGEYPLTGTVAVTGACNSTYTFTQGLVAGVILQSSGALQSQFQIGPTVPTFLQAGISPSTGSRPNMLATFVNPAGCPNGGYSGNLTPQ